MQFPYREQHADGVVILNVAADFNTVVEDGASGDILRVKLAGEAEVLQLIAELDDPDGELCWKEGSICTKYEALHNLRP